MSISFRANPVAATVLQTQSQENNALGLSENGQKVLSKINMHTNIYDLANTIVDSDKRKENLATVAKNTLMMPVMSSPTVSSVYTADQYRKGNISQNDAAKIMAYNAMAQVLYDS